MINVKAIKSDVKKKPFSVEKWFAICFEWEKNIFPGKGK